MFLRPILPACRTYASTSTAADRLAAKATGSRSKRSTWANLGAVCLLALGMIFSPTAAHAVTAAAYFAGMQTTLSAPGGGYTDPLAIAVDTHGNVFVADGTAGVGVFEIPVSTNTAVLLGGSFPYTSGIAPAGLTLDAASNVFFADGSGNINEIPAAGGYTTVTTFTGLSSGGAFNFNGVYGLAVDSSGNIYVTCTSTTVNATVGPGGLFEIQAVSGSVPATGATVIQLGGTYTFTQAGGVALDSGGNLFVTDDGAGNVFELAPPYTATLANPVITGIATTAEALAVDADDNIYIADTGLSSVQEYTAASIYATVIPQGTGLNFPLGVAVDSSDNIYIANAGGANALEIQLGAVNVGPVTLTNPTIPATATLTFNFPGASPITLGTNIVLPAVKPFGALPSAPNEFADAGTGTCTTSGTYDSSPDTPSCTVNINFTPAYPGQRIGTVELQNSGNNILASVDVYGNGISPQVAFTPGVINVVAGQNGIACSGSPCGDGGSPTSAMLQAPTGAAVDAAGNLFIADQEDSVVREIAAGSNTITTVAGNYTPCTPGSAPNPPTCTGDGGPATSAQLDAPAAVAVDAAGDLFIADSSAQTIREVSATGVISTVAGGSAEPFTPGQPCPLGPGTVTDIVGDGCLATASTLVSPFDVVLDASGNFYIADQSAGLIRKVSAATGVITAVAGSTSPTTTIAATNPCPSNAGDTATDSIGDGCPATDPSVNLGGPLGVAVDPSGNIYIADPANNHIREVSAATGIITIVAGGTITPFTIGDACPSSPSLNTTDTFGDGCPAIDAELSNPVSVRLDAAGNLYIVGQDDSLVRKVDTSGIITTVIGGGSATVATTPCPVGSGGTAIDTAGDGCAATSATLNFPSGIAVDQAGNLYIADSENDTVREVTVGQPAPLVFSTSGSPTSLLSTTNPLFVTLYNSGNASLFFPDPIDNFTINTPNPSNVETSAFFLDSGTNNLCNTNNTAGDYLLAPGANCLYAIDFSPQGGGLLSDTFSIYDNSLPNIGGDVQQISVSGYGALQTPTFAGDMSFSPAATETFGESPAITVSETLDFTGSTAPTTGDVTFTLNSVSYTATSCNTVSGGVSCSATIPAATINALSPDIYPTTASFSGDSNFNAASDSTGASFTITQQTPTFGTIGFSPSSLAFGDTADTVTISAVVNYSGSTAPTGTFGFVFPVAGANYAATCVPGSGSSLNCSGTITAGSLTVSGSPYAGTISYSGDTNFAAASANSGTFNVIKASQAITSFSGVPPTAIFGGDAIFYTLNSIPGTSTSPVVYSIDPATTAFAFITGLGNNQVAIAAAGTVVVDANQAADANYNAAPQVQQTIIVSQGTPLLDINSSHSDPFYPGQTNATLTLTVDNLNGTANTDGSTITVTDTLAAGLTPTGATGTGWICGVAGQVVTCTGDDIIAGDVTNGVANPGTGASDPNTIAVAVNVGPVDNDTIFAGATVSTSQTVTGGNSAQNTGTDTVNIGQNFFSVNTTSDPSGGGTASNCAIGNSLTCSLRDAVAAAAAVQSVVSGITPATTVPTIINFDGGVFATPQTIALTHGLMALPSNTFVNGATSGSGATLTNLVTIDGSGDGPNDDIFQLQSSSITGVVLNNLNITGGDFSGGFGGAISSVGGLTINECNLTNNHAGQSGGAIYNSGSLTVNNSTLSGNSSGNGGGGIYNETTGALIVNYSTITGNTAVGGGGGITSANTSGVASINNSTIVGNTSSGGQGGGVDVPGQLQLNNSIVAGNTATPFADLSSGPLSHPGSFFNNASSGTLSINGSLSALGNYGGPTQTFLALPGGSAICAGFAGVQPGGFTADQRGDAMLIVYGGNSCVDAGSTETKYTLTFTTSPSATGNVIASTLTPNPAVTLTETTSNSSTPVTGISVTAAFNANPGDLTGTTTATTTAATNTGVATFTNLQSNALDTGETITASVSVGPAGTITATSSSFTVGQATPSFAVAGLSPAEVLLGSTTPVTISNLLTYPSNASAPDTSSGQVTFTLSSGHAPYVATCSLEAPGTLSCSATVPGTDVAALTLTGNPYTATSSYAGDDNYTAATGTNSNDLTIVTPVLAISSSHTDPFYPGQTNATFTLTIDNFNGTANTSGQTITVTDLFATGLTPVSAFGTGWSCGVATHGITCTGNDVIGIGFADPNTITVTVNVGNGGPVVPGAQLSTSQTVIGGGSAQGTGSDLVNIGQDVFIVNTTVDPSSGTPASCATGSINGCSLRDAIAAATTVQNNANGSTIPTTINFDGTVFNSSNTVAQNTISLSHGSLNVPPTTTIQGATSGSNLTLTNLVTIDGSLNGSNGLFSGFGVGVVLNNLNLVNASSSGNGGAIHNDFGSSLTVHECNLINNTGLSGGAIFNNGTLEVDNSTISANSAQASGGGIYNESAGTLTVNYSTVTQNNANGTGGGIDSENSSATTTINNSTITNNAASNAGGLHAAGPLTLSDSVVAQNNASLHFNDVSADTTLTQSGNVFNAASSLATSVASGLSAFGSYGGPTKTFMAEPDGVAICAGVNASQPDAPFNTDQRGSSPFNFISVSHFCVDAGSTQSLYSLGFTTSPSLNGNLPNVALSPHPQVTLAETSSNVSSLSNGITIAASLTNNPSFTAGTTTVSTNTSGVASFGNLQSNAADAGETITATVPIGIYSLTATSSTFNVGLASPTVAISAVSAPAGSTAGVSITATSSGSAGSTDGSVVTFSVTGTATGSFSPTTCTIASGTCSVNYIPTGTLAAGTYTNDISGSFSAAGNYTTASATSTLTITTVAPTTKTVSAASAPAGSTAGVTVTATETGGAGTTNGGIVTFSVTGSATGSFSPTTCTLSSGTCTVQYIPTGTLAASTYTNDISASFGAVLNYNSASATSTLTITTVAPTTATVSAVSAPAGSTTGITVTATETGGAGTTNGGVVTFGTANGATGSFSPTTCTLASGTCTTTYTPTGSLAAATYANGITASFAAVANYNAASATSNLTITTIAPTTTTISAVSSPFGSTTGVTVTVTETGGAGTTNGGIVTFGTANGATGSFSPTTCTLSSGTCTTSYIPTGTLAASTYTNGITASFAAVANYNSASATSNLTITTIAPTTATVSAVSAPAGSTTGVTVTVNESGTGGTTNGGVVTFGTANGATGSFSPTTCTLASGTCTTTYTPTGSLAAATYTNGITASFAAVGNYSSASATSNLTITTVAPTTATVSAVSAPAGSTTGITVTATETGGAGTTNTGVVTFGTANGATGSFSPTTCTLSAGTCTTTYTPTGSLAAATYANGITASFAAVNNYNAASATSNLTITTVAPTTATVSAVSAPAGSTTGITVTVSESGGAGTTNTGVVTFGLANGATGSFSPTTCTLSAGTCTTTYTPTGSLAAATYANGITASFAAVANYNAASATSNLVITTVAPTTATVSAVSAPAGSTTGVTVTVSESGGAGTTNGGIVTFGLQNGATGSFSPTTCTLSSGTCTTTYTPTGTLAASIYTNSITASFAAVANYNAASATNNLTITTVNPTTATVSTVSSPFGSTSGVSVTVTESGGAGVVTGGVVTFGTAGGVGGSFSPATCTLPVGGSCSVNYIPSGTLSAGTYPTDITASFAAVNNYNAASATNTLTITTIAPTTKTVSAVSAPAGSTTGVTVTATESGSGGAVTGGVVTFGLAGSATGSFSPATCTLPVGGSCTTTYIPTGSLAAGTYASDITASFGAVGNYAAANAVNTLTITTVAPTTATVSSVFAPAGSTAGVTVTVNESGGAGVVTGGVVTFGVANGATGTFSPTTCNLSSGGTCSVSYIPTGVLAANTYTNGITASFGAINNYNSATASSNLVVGNVTPTTSVSAVSSVFGTTTGVTVTATESGTAGVVTGGVVTFGTAGSATGSFSPTTCTLPVGGSCSVTYIPAGTLTAGTYTSDITASFTATGNYASATASNTLTISQASSTVVLTQVAPSTIGSIGVGVSSSFTATVTDGSANSTGSPTGTVNFFDGATLLNNSPIALSSGTATITGVIFTTVTTHSITAVYNGDANFTGNTSSPLSENVVTPAFSVSANPNSLTIAQGNSGTATLTFTPVGNYTGTLALNCTGLPAFSSCQFLPATITFTGNNAQQTSQLTVFTLNAHAVPGGSSQSLLWFPAAGMLAMLIAVRRRKLARTLRPLLMVAIAALAMTALTGCGSGATFITPTGNNTVTVTASATGTGASGNLNQTTTITIIITQ